MARSTFRSTIGRTRKSLILKHQKGHWVRLFRGTVPVFVAVTVNRTVNQLLNVVVGNAEPAVATAIQFSYALLIAHLMGYIFVFYVPQEHPLFSFYLSLATDNSSFAWNNAITSVIIKWLYDSANVYVALAALGILVGLVLIIILATAWVKNALSFFSADQQLSIRHFESESFALAIAYSLTIIVSSSIFMPEVDDELETDDNFTPGVKTWWYFFYICGISIAVLLHEKFVTPRTATLGDYLSAAQDDPQQNTAGHERSRQTLPHAGREDHEQDDEYEEDELEEENMEDAEIEEILNEHLLEPFELSQRSSRNRSRPDRPISALPQCRGITLSYGCLFYTSLGYLIACGWHVFCVVVFENLFTFRGGDVVGVLLYALLATLCIASGMTISSIAAERDALHKPLIDHNDNAIGTHNPSNNPYSGIVFSAFGSLLVGWAWQTFFVTLFGYFIPNHKDGTGLAVLASITVAAIVLLCAVRVELVLHHRKLKRHAKRQSQTRAHISDT